MRNELFLSKRLETATFKLNLLLEITQSINDNLSTKELLDAYKKILVTNFSVGSFLLFVKNIDWQCVLNNGIYGIEDSDVNQFVEDFLHQLTDIENIVFINKLFVVIPITHHEKALAYLLITDKAKQKESAVIKHLRFIQIITNIVVSAIETRNLYEEKLQKEALNKELEIAADIQNLLVPNAKSLPHNSNLDVASFYKPQSLVGGDYYDFLQLTPVDYGFCIADVSGIGIAAALLMANFQANVRAFASFGLQVELAHIVEQLDVYINNILNGEKFITFFIARYNTETKLLTYINAGHNPPVFWSAASQTVRYCTEGCVGLGMLDHIDHITQGEIHVATGDKLLCYTDGLSEAENEKLEEFGTHEIDHALAQEGSIHDSIAYINSKLQSFIGTNSLNDDITMLGIDFK